MRKASYPLEEDHLTEQYMSDYGIENVRGGCYSQMDLPEETIRELERKFSHSRDECLGCGQLGHFIQDCPMPVNQSWLGGQGSDAFNEEDEEEEDDEEEEEKSLPNALELLSFFDHFNEDADPWDYDDDDD